jgi:hypothetical protein
MSIAFDLWGQRGWARVEVAGESHHAKDIRAVFGSDFKPNGSEITVETQLRPEPGNRFDRNAVAVWSGPYHLGYLPREEAARYVAVLSGLVANNWTPQCKARVWAAEWSHEDDERPGQVEFRGRVTLDLAEPHMLVPANLPPSGEHRTLPLGGAIQVTGEENHLDALQPLLRPEGECWAYVTLHEILEETARTSKTVVEVRVDDERVGQLTPKMSGELLPAVRHLAETGASTSARAIVKGNRIKAEVVLYVARAHELPDTWLNGSDRTPQAAAEAVVATAGVPRTQPREHSPIPPPPTSIRFTVPQGWPAAPAGWVPPPGWRPDPAWPPAPAGWQWWVPAWD